MHIRLHLDVAYESHPQKRRTRLERDVDLIAVPRVGDWVDLTGAGVAQPVDRVVFTPLNGHVDVILEPVEASDEQMKELLHVLPAAGWVELREADRW